MKPRPITDPLERIFRPIIEGQLKGFLKEHPEVLEAVTWYKGNKSTREETFIGSISKRIIGDLLSADRARLVEAAQAAKLPPSRKRRPGMLPGAPASDEDGRANCPSLPPSDALVRQSGASGAERGSNPALGAPYSLW